MPRPLRLVIAALLIAGAALWLVAQRPATGDGGPNLHKETLYVFGTLVEIVVRDAAADEARQAVAALERDFQRMHTDWHAWKPGELSRLNAAIAAGRPMEVSDFLLPVIEQGIALERAADGLFNPAIGGLIDLWGFHADELPQGALPDFAAVRSLAARRPSMTDLIIRGRQVVSRNPAVSLDFGGFAKGTALDRAVAVLRSRGIDHAIINAGGDINVIGQAAGRPWRVGIRHPRTWGVIASAQLADGEVMYTSGNYERFREHEGVRYAHIIDPRDGMPVAHIVSATVIHDEGAVADAAATALTVAGPNDWHRIARGMGIKYAMLVDADGTVYANPAMIDRLTFEPGEPQRLVIGPELQ